MTVEWLICCEPVHIGGADSSIRGNNNPIYRLSDRTPAIPGSSVRGALREHAENHEDYKDLVNNWFGKKLGKNEEISDNNVSRGGIALSWAWPVWWPVHVLGYGNWWISCLGWLNRFQQLSQQSVLNLEDRNLIYITEQQLKGKDVFLRWLKLKNVQYDSEITNKITKNLPRSQNIPSIDIPSDRLIVVPDTSINLFVDMGLVRQPRVSIKDEPDEKGNLIDNLFAVEGLPPGAVFFITWTTRGELQKLEKWEKFLHDEHYLGGLWSVGYGRVVIQPFSGGK
ncbi:RAMP superfamily CRISPR-associated protein [Limnoraphis robusta]|uniref:CRISPR-associated protein n=1 Tax=Limnoraphis robusta CS-951 TaxID=1637645 RepID=A0A0F5YGE0_9CYAN|nr:RAMP superfamily CRISPR-associated protein [Limnoraphis robusta]KKD37828.1 CRISPR-associated protein [Limnoraphis robusta CS-951]